MKYIIVIIVFISFCSGIFCYGITIGKKMQIAEYQDMMNKYRAETMNAISKANKELNEARNNVEIKYRDRVVIKHIQDAQNESCVSKTTIASVLNTGGQK